MSDEQIDQELGQEDVKDQAPTSQGQADTAVTADSENAKTESSDIREDLVKELMQSPVEEQHEESTPDETPEETTEDDEDDDESPEESKDAPKAEDGQDLESNQSLGERTRKTITTLRQKAAFGDLITKTLVDANIKPEEFSRWTNLAARLKKGDESAVAELVATAKAFGYKEQIAKVEDKPPVKTVDDVADEIYKSEFARDVEDLNISEPLARKQARKLAELQRVEKREEVREVKQPVENQQQVDPIRSHALKTLAVEEQQIREKVKDYDKIAKTVTERLVKEYGTTDPIYWVEGYKSIVRDELRKIAPAPPPKKEIKPVAGTQVRPTQSNNQAPSKELNLRDSLAKSILTGKFD